MPTTDPRPLSCRRRPARRCSFGFSDGGKTFVGVVVAVRKMNRTHVYVEVQMNDVEYARLLGADAV